MYPTLLGQTINTITHILTIAGNPLTMEEKKHEHAKPVVLVDDREHSTIICCGCGGVIMTCHICRVETDEVEGWDHIGRSVHERCFHLKNMTENMALLIIGAILVFIAMVV